MTTPSKEALSAAGKLSQRRMLYEWDGRIGHPGSASPLEAATLIDTAFAEHRERVAALVEAARRAREELDTALDRIVPSEIERSIARLDAALAPFLQETPP